MDKARLEFEEKLKEQEEQAGRLNTLAAEVGDVHKLCAKLATTVAGLAAAATALTAAATAAEPPAPPEAAPPLPPLDDRDEDDVAAALEPLPRSA